jgi:hypothetical protein
MPTTITAAAATTAVAKPMGTPLEGRTARIRMQGEGVVGSNDGTPLVSLTIGIFSMNVLCCITYMYVCVGMCMCVCILLHVCMVGMIVIYVHIFRYI